MPQVIRAQHLGFCFGVRDALQVAESIEQPEETAVFGELVHNERVTSDLRGRGFELVAERKRSSKLAKPNIMVTAHGISDTRRRSLEESGHRLIDTTCPLVRRVHDAAQGLAARGFFVIVVGKPDHVEVQGITEDLPIDGYAVVDSIDAVERYPADRIGVVCQTTTPEALAMQCKERITKLNPQATLRWINTVCRPTKQRQSAVDQLCTEVSVVVVVGGQNSNNTRRLAERCRSNGVDAFHVQSPADLPKSELSKHSRIGLTAGTSTPDETIDAVEAALVALQPDTRPSAFQNWIQHFEENLPSDPRISWTRHPTLTDAERRDVVSSIQTFQLGESGEGKHLIRCAESWVRKGGDAGYLCALRLFIEEENQHARWLGRFLLQEQAPLLEKQWSDSCFRFLRHLAGLRTSICVLVTAEILAQVYYLALLRATDSPCLQQICRRILRDEKFHVAFQRQQANRLSSRWSGIFRLMVSGFERALFEVAKRIVWRDHRSVFGAAGMDWRNFCNRSDRRWSASRRNASRDD
ncbi:MAG: 4-hydroxy-3-methylbut-2-enyl diphosphate reductase [Planctomycetota bacterium]